MATVEAKKKAVKQSAKSKAKPKASARSKAAPRPSAPAKRSAAKGKPRAKKKAPAKRKATGKAKAPARSWPRRVARGSAALLFGGVMLFLLGSAAWVLLYAWINPPVTMLMLMEGKPAGAAWREWRSLDSLGTNLPVAVLASEDQRFPDHHGVDTRELRFALADALRGERLRGASTISQQTAKNAFLWPSRSLARKGLEYYFTFLVESFWSKERILEVYLNIIEMGPGVYGAERAALHYFGKPAQSLSAAEAALIAAALPRPRLANPAQPDEELKTKQAWILEQMRNLGGERFLEKIE